MKHGRQWATGGLGLVAVLLVPASARADDAAASDTAPVRRGAYVAVAVGQNKYDLNCGELVIAGPYCTHGRSSALMARGGYRFGVTSLEALYVDLGSASVGATAYASDGRLHASGVGAGVAWSARFGQHFEATWRLGGANLSATLTGLSGKQSAVRPYFGMEAAWFFDDHLAAVMAVDAFRGHAGDEPLGFADYSGVVGSLGLRWRF